MPRLAQGPRLYLRTGRINPRTKLPLPDVYVIRDGSTQKSTGCGADRLREAQLAFARYLAGQTVRPTTADLKPPPVPSRQAPADEIDRVPVAEVLTFYVDERAPELASSPVTMAGFIRALLSFWGDKFIDDVKRSTCKAYVKHRTAQTVQGAQPGARLVSEQTARRELEVLSAAIGYWHAETPLPLRPKIWLPARAESPRDALTRGQAAALLLAARGYRRDGDGVLRRLVGSQRENRAHLARFILIGLYTGTRSAAIRALLWEPSANQAWVDLQGGMIYRKGLREREHANKRRPIARLPRRLLGHLRRWKALDEAAAAKSGRRLDHVLHHGGAPIATKVNKGFDAVVKDAGLKDVTPHWLRHTCATWLMEAGVDLWEAAAYTGMSPAVLLKHYGHHRSDQHRAARAAF